MIQKIFLVILSFFALQLSAAVHATTIDFSTFPVDTAITNQYVGDGVTFRGIENGLNVPIVIASFTGNNNLSNCYPTQCASRADIVEVSFSSPASNVSFDIDSQGGSSITFNAYNSSNVLLETFTVTGAVPVIFTVSGISRIDMLQPTENWGWGFRNLIFDAVATAVPTMSVWSLGLLVSLLGLYSFRKRRVR